MITLNNELKCALAAEFVVGTMIGTARTRFQRLMREDSKLKSAVIEWEEILIPQLDMLPEIEPNEKVWLNIKNRCV